MGIRMTTLALALGVLAPISTARAQTTGQLSVGGGSATDERGVRSNAMTVAPSITFAGGSDAHLSLAGTGTFFQQGAWSLGGALAAESRARVGGGFAVALSTTASASRTSYDAAFAEGELTPVAEWSWSGLTLFGGASAAAGYAAVSTARQVGLFPGTTTLVSATRTLTAPVYGARWRLVGDDPSVAGELSFRDEPMSVGGVRVTDRTLRGAMAAGAVTVAASLGRREAPDERVTFGSASFDVAVAPAVSLEVGAGRYPSDRLTGAAGGNYVAAGLTLRVGGASPPHLPEARGAPAPPVGTTRLSIRAPDAGRVEIAGDWNGWQLVPASRAGNGVWYADLPLPPGQYRYAFRIDGHAWRVPEGAVTARDGFGGESAYVTVQDTGATGSHATMEER
ncbi:MAG: hypothetical protein KGN74_10795 [Gemmatimonadota bacterium]|nr:hypothetical protein [Gemmatimonadota bacterium]